MTDLSGLPAGWHWATMGDISRVVGGSTPKTGESSYWGGDIPWITPDDLSGFTDKHIERGRRSITKAGYGSCSTQMVPAGTVLFTSRAPIGYVAIAANPLCTNQGFKSFVCRSDVDSGYVYWYLAGSSEVARRMASGTTFLELSGRAAARIPIPVPPLNTQRKIVAVVEQQLTRIDAAARSFNDALAKLRRYRTALLNEVVPSNAAAFPDHWGSATVGELATRVQYGTSAKATDEMRGVPVLRMGNIVDGNLSTVKLKYLPADHPEFPELLLHDGDLLFNRTNSPELVGKSAVYRGKPSPCSFASYLIRVQLGPDLQPEFLAHALNGPYGRRWITSVVSQQVGQANVNGSKLKAFRIPAPPIAEQRRLVEMAESRLSFLEDSQAEIRKNLLRAQSLRQAILRQAFAGRLA
ncbi:MAG: restriction endonuclease subunit S [Chloroflexi bacterium]|nr:restriction endonuclease subunit S [Chloroflexota bacterium]